MGNRVADARNQVKRWEKKFPPHVARMIIEDMLAHSHSPRNREIYKAWLDAHPEPIQGQTIMIEQFRVQPTHEPKSPWEYAEEFGRGMVKDRLSTTHSGSSLIIGDTFDIPQLPPTGPTAEEAEYTVHKPQTMGVVSLDEVRKKVGLPEIEFTVNRPKPEPIPGITEHTEEDRKDWGPWGW